jgi:tetratricopeptide (TPR) repeat protein
VRVGDWAERYRDGESRLPDDPDERQRQLTRLGNCAWAAGMAELLAGKRDEAVEWLDRACERYRESYELAPVGSWGRPIAILKARLIAGRDARPDAEWTLAQHPERSESPIAHYAAALALLVLERYQDARPAIAPLRDREDFPSDVADALAAVAAEDRVAYIEAIESVLESFETRDAYLEDMPVADTVLVLEALAARRDLEAELPPSTHLPRSAHL